MQDSSDQAICKLEQENKKLKEILVRKDKKFKVRTRMVVVRMVRARNMSVSETADIQGRCPNWVCNRLCRYDGGLKASFVVTKQSVAQRQQPPVPTCMKHEPVRCAFKAVPRLRSGTSDRFKPTNIISRQ